MGLSVIFNFALFGCLTLLVLRFKARIPFKATVQSDIEEHSEGNPDPVYEEVLSKESATADPGLQNNICYSEPQINS